MTFHAVLQGILDAFGVLGTTMGVVVCFLMGYVGLPMIRKSRLDPRNPNAPAYGLQIAIVIGVATLVSVGVWRNLGYRIESEDVRIREWYPTDSERTTAAVATWLVMAVPAFAGIACRAKEGNT